MLLTKPIFPHPPQVDDPYGDPKQVCRLCGYRRDRAIHYGNHEYPRLWIDNMWWPAHSDGDAGVR